MVDSTPSGVATAGGSTTWLVGLLVGITIGVLSGILLILILSYAASGAGRKKVLKVIGFVSTLVGFAYGGTWLERPLLKGATGGDFLSFYLLSFTIMFFLIAATTLVSFVKKIAARVKAASQLPDA